MFVLTFLLVGIVVTLHFYRDTRLALWLRAYIVLPITERMSSVRALDILIFVIGLMIFQGFVMTMGYDLAYLLALDLSAYVEAAVVVWSLAAVARGRGVLARISRALSRESITRRGSTRNSRARRSASPKRRGADDDSSGRQPGCLHYMGYHQAAWG